MVCQRLLYHVRQNPGHDNPMNLGLTIQLVKEIFPNAVMCNSQEYNGNDWDKIPIGMKVLFTTQENDVLDIYGILDDRYVVFCDHAIVLDWENEKEFMKWLEIQKSKR